MSDDQLQCEHQKRRRQLYSLGAGMTGALAAAPPSHGASLLGLGYTVPRSAYVGYRKRKADKEMAKRGVDKLEHTWVDVVMPLTSGVLTATLGGMADGVHGLADAQGLVDATHHIAQHQIQDSLTV